MASSLCLSASARWRTRLARASLRTARFLGDSNCDSSPDSGPLLLSSEWRRAWVCSTSSSMRFAASVSFLIRAIASCASFGFFPTCSAVVSALASFSSAAVYACSASLAFCWAFLTGPVRRSNAICWLTPFCLSFSPSLLNCRARFSSYSTFLSISLASFFSPSILCASANALRRAISALPNKAISLRSSPSACCCRFFASSALASSSSFTLATSVFLTSILVPSFASSSESALSLLSSSSSSSLLPRMPRSRSLLSRSLRSYSPSPRARRSFSPLTLESCCSSPRPPSSSEAGSWSTRCSSMSLMASNACFLLCTFWNPASPRSSVASRSDP
mmetsp:Transcript_2931/g.5951  ORF Transcript_2931/g.5951 Transcript_2931/m.5951 type:complete len:333 (+) Transcript_2931:274-1272(+)